MTLHYITGMVHFITLKQSTTRESGMRIRGMDGVECTMRTAQFMRAGLFGCLFIQCIWAGL